MTIESYCTRLRENDPTLTSISFPAPPVARIEKEEEGIAIAQALMGNYTLTKLNLQAYQVKNEAAKILAEALKVNHTLTALSLKRHRMTREALGLVRKANTIKEEGAIALAEALKVNKILIKFDFNGIHTEKNGLKAFTEALKVNYALLEFSISFSLVSSSSSNEDTVAKTEINSYLERNRDLVRQAFEAIRQENKEQLVELVKQGISINARNGDKTLLHEAIILQQIPIVKFLFKQGANPNIPTSKGKTPLMLALKTGNRQLIALIKAHQSNVQATNPIQPPDSNETTPSIPQSFPLEEAETEVTEDLLRDTVPPDTSLLEEVARRLHEQQRAQTESLEEKFEALQEKLDAQLEAYQTTKAQLEAQKQTFEAELSELRSDNSESAEKIEHLKNKVLFIEAQQQILWEAHQVKQAKKSHLERLKQEPNQRDFYLKIIATLEALFISAKAAAGPFTSGVEGSVGRTARRVSLLGEVIDLVPLVGQWGEKLIRGTAVKTLTQADGIRQKNIAQRIADLATLTEIQKEVEEAARFLTECYSRQLQQLVLREEPTRTANVQRNLLKKNLLSSAQKVAVFASVWIYEIFTSGKINEEGSISGQIIQIVVTKRPRGVKGGAQATTSSKQPKISQKLERKTVKTQTGKKWAVRDLFTKPGLETEEGHLYRAKWTDHDIFGYCLGTKEMAEAKGLKWFSTSNQKPQWHPSSGWQQQFFETNRTNQETSSRFERVEKTFNIRLEQQSKKIASLEAQLNEERQKRLETEAKMNEMQEKITRMLESQNRHVS